MANTATGARSVTKIGNRLPGDYFSEAEGAFARAAAKAGGVSECFISVAGIRICLRTAGDTLLPQIAPTLAHLEVSSRTAIDFTICCWDGKATEVEMPYPTWWMLNPTINGCIHLLTNARYRTFHIEWMKFLASVDTKGNIAYCCYEDAERLLMYEVSGPLRAIFGLILNQKGMQIVHASAVGTGDGSVLMAGPPGSGKSTLALLCLQEGLLFQSDDLCVLTGEERPRSLSLYNIAKLREDMLPRFESWHPILSYFEEENSERKAFFYMHRHFPEKVLNAAPVRALILPSVSGESTSRLERATSLEAFRGVVAWTIKEVPKSDGTGEKIMLQAISRIPAYRLILGGDDKETVALIRSLL